MSSFKVLAAVAVWVLFIWGIATILITEVRYWVNTGITNAPTLPTFLGWALGSVQLTLSVVCMKLRRALE
jgi:hypothetical protein